MAYGIMPYLVDWELLKGLYGSNNEEVLESVKKKMGRKVESLKMNFDEDALDYLSRIIKGDTESDQNYMYWYALELVCDCYGRFMNNGEWYPTDSWYDLTDLIVDELPFRLPPPDDFPGCYTVAPESMEELSTSVEASSSIGEAAKEQVLFWLKRGRETGRALVLFYY